MRIDIQKIIEQLDEEHAFFLSFVNSLYIKENYDNELTKEKLIDTGVDYIANHILREERVMKHFKYPFLAEHILSHTVLQNTFLLLIKEITLDSLSQEQIIKLLEETIVNHIKIEDAKFFKWLNQ